MIECVINIRTVIREEKRFKINKKSEENGTCMVF